MQVPSKRFRVGGTSGQEVSAIYPDLVIRDEAGVIQGIRYDELAPLLLSEVQQQRHELQTLQQQIADMKEANAATQLALRKIQATDPVAGRE